MTSVDLIIEPEWIIPIVPDGAVYRDCALVIDNQRIKDILPVAESQAQYQANETIQLPGQALLPGLVNAHGHAAMTLFRGYADDHNLNTWLEEHIWPAETQWVDATFVRDGARHACAEMILSGTTCFSDMYFFSEVTAEVANQAGLRAQIAFPVMEFPSPWGQGPDEYLRKGIELIDQYRGHSRISVAFGPHAPYTVSDDTFTRVRTLSDETDTHIQVHLHETAYEVETSLQQYGMRPIERLDSLGVLGPRTQAVHMTQLTYEDITACERTNTRIVHCPKSNLKLASGLSPTAELRARGLRVGLGSDSAASNNSLNLFDEMRFASLLAKLQAQDATALSASESLYLATLGGAEVLGIDHEVGSLEPGKSADVISVRLDSIDATPLYNPISQLVYATHQGVENLWVQGKSLLRDRALQTVNHSEITARSAEWASKISGA